MVSFSGYLGYLCGFLFLVLLLSVIRLSGREYRRLGSVGPECWVELAHYILESLFNYFIYGLGCWLELSNFSLVLQFYIYKSSIIALYVFYYIYICNYR